MADPSGSGEPVPAPTSYRATQEALEALDRLYAELEEIGGARGMPDWMERDRATVRAALGSARPPLPPQEISPPRVEVGDVVWQAAQDELIRVRFEELPPNPDNWFQGQVHPEELRDALNAAFARVAWLRVRGEPSREPTLEEIDWKRLAWLLRDAAERLPHDDVGRERYGDLLGYAGLIEVNILRARLSSPEAPR